MQSTGTDCGFVITSCTWQPPEHSECSGSTQSGQPAVLMLVGIRFSLPEAYPASCTMGTGSLCLGDRHSAAGTWRSPPPTQYSTTFKKE
jgi:hypothetical protein